LKEFLFFLQESVETVKKEVTKRQKN